MPERAKAAELLARARRVYDAPGSPLPALAAESWQGGFASGARWMHAALAHLRGQPVARSKGGLQALGILKYGLATAASLLVAALAPHLGWWLLLLCVPAFYAVEAQMVFLFPLVLDGSPRPFREARRMTRDAGGTLAVMRCVMPIAAVMLFGGLLRQGFLRSWCRGCLAVCLWYEALRAESGPATC